MLHEKSKAILAKNKDCLELKIYLHNYLTLFDKLNFSTLSKEFHMVYLDKAIYTMEQIANLTGNSIDTIRRHIRKFNQYLDIDLNN